MLPLWTYLSNPRTPIWEIPKSSPLLQLVFPPGGPVPSGVTVTRATSKLQEYPAGTVTSVGSNVGSVEARGLIIEPAHTNLMLQSQALATSPWSTFGSVAAAPTVTNNTTDVTAPDGTSTATKLVYPATSGANQVTIALQSLTLTASQTYTVSAWVRGTGSQTFFMDVDIGGNWGTGSGKATLSLTTAWQRVSLTVTPTSGVSSNFNFGSDTRTTNANEPNMAAQTVYIWGVQVETNAFATSYVPTTTTTATCNADDVSAPFTHVPVPKGRAEIVFTPESAMTAGIFGLFAFTTSNTTGLWLGVDANSLVAELGGVGVVLSTIALTWVPGTQYHVTLKWGNGVYSAYLNGVLEGSASGQAMPTGTPTGLFPGTIDGADDQLCGGLKSLAFYAS